jgi:hypothetical protein
MLLLKKKKIMRERGWLDQFIFLKMVINVIIVVEQNFLIILVQILYYYI